MLKGLDNPSRIQPALAGAFVSKLDVDPKFIAAIEAALGRNLQAIILEDASVGAGNYGDVDEQEARPGRA